MIEALKKVHFRIRYIKNIFTSGVIRSYIFAPPGHFYSPIPSIDEVRKNEASIWDKNQETNEAIELNEMNQLKLLTEFRKYYGELPFSTGRTNNLRYFYENPSYSYGDAITLFSMIRTLKPQRIIEVGSGYSSCVMMDTNELFFAKNIKLTFIEPYPDLLFSLMKKGDVNNYTVLPKRIQDVELGLFEQLEENDILFIDSSHVSKTGSDVNYIFFQVLPRLKKGVYIHFHDIFFPFEYPKDWVLNGRAWNEDYILRAFLSYNSSFKIVFFANYLAQTHLKKLQELLPLFLKNSGANIWIQRWR